MVTDNQIKIFAERVEAYDADAPGYAKRWNKMCERLLMFGGEAVVPHFKPDLWCVNNPRRMGVHLGPTLLRLGDPCECHRNSSRLLINNEADSIVTGYGLSDDGLWRQHSWGQRGDCVIETTERRIRYCGIRLSFPEALRFIMAEDLHDELEAALDKSYEVLL